MKIDAQFLMAGFAAALLGAAPALDLIGSHPRTTRNPPSRASDAGHRGGRAAKARIIGDGGPNPLPVKQGLIRPRPMAAAAAASASGLSVRPPRRVVPQTSDADLRDAA